MSCADGGPLPGQLWVVRAQRRATLAGAAVMFALPAVRCADYILAQVCLW